MGRRRSQSQLTTAELVSVTGTPAGYYSCCVHKGLTEFSVHGAVARAVDLYRADTAVTGVRSRHGEVEPEDTKDVGRLCGDVDHHRA